MIDLLTKQGEINMPKFSIVTPSYNSWKYMESYFESLEAQSFKDFEVVIVDDCSSDETYEQILKYSEQSSLNIRLVKNKNNSGPGYSRNRGIKLAKGEWLTFVDSDDSIDPQLLSIVNDIFESNKRAAVPIECIVYDYNTVSSQKTSKASSVYGSHHGGILSVNEAISDVRNHTFGKFYNLSVIKEKNIIFPSIKRCEDVAFTCQAIDACCMNGKEQIGLVYYLKNALYNYYQRSSSLSNDKSLDSRDMVCAYRVINYKLGKKYPEELCEKSVSDLLYGGVLMKCKSGRNIREIKRYIASYEKRYPNWYKCKMVHKLGKAKLLYLMCIRKRKYRELKLLATIHSKLVG